MKDRLKDVGDEQYRRLRCAKGFYVRVQIADNKRFKFSKKITRGCYLLPIRSEMEWIILNYMSEWLFFILSRIEHLENLNRLLSVTWTLSYSVWKSHSMKKFKIRKAQSTNAGSFYINISI